jgi:hypothetical protein
MKLLAHLLLLMTCMSLCAAQEPKAQPDAPPGLVVLKVKWERRLESVADSARSSQGISRTASSPDALNNDVLPTPSKSTFPPYVYEYKVEIRNDLDKKINSLKWVYVLVDLTNHDELGRHEFVANDKIGPGEKKTLIAIKRSAPSQLVSVENLKKKKGAGYEERVDFQCVAYSDGTIWHAPSIPEYACADMEKQRKPR